MGDTAQGLFDILSDCAVDGDSTARQENIHDILIPVPAVFNA
jgi:hypothetical protein